jgi:hypothetical protein
MESAASRPATPAAGTAGVPGALAALGKTRAVLLETRKRDGTWVKTAVSVVIDGGHAYFRTYDASGKYKPP